MASYQAEGFGNEYLVSYFLEEILQSIIHSTFPVESPSPCLMSSTNMEHFYSSDAPEPEERKGDVDEDENITQMTMAERDEGMNISSPSPVVKKVTFSEEVIHVTFIQENTAIEITNKKENHDLGEEVKNENVWNEVRVALGDGSSAIEDRSKSEHRKKMEICDGDGKLLQQRGAQCDTSTATDEDSGCNVLYVTPCKKAKLEVESNVDLQIVPDVCEEDEAKRPSDPCNLRNCSKANKGEHDVTVTKAASIEENSSCRLMPGTCMPPLTEVPGVKQEEAVVQNGRPALCCPAADVISTGLQLSGEDVDLVDKQSSVNKLREEEEDDKSSFIMGGPCEDDVMNECWCVLQSVISHIIQQEDVRCSSKPNTGAVADLAEQPPAKKIRLSAIPDTAQRSTLEFPGFKVAQPEIKHLSTADVELLVLASSSKKIRLSAIPGTDERTDPIVPGLESAQPYAMRKEDEMKHSSTADVELVASSSKIRNMGEGNMEPVGDCEDLEISGDCMGYSCQDNILPHSSNSSSSTPDVEEASSVLNDNGAAKLLPECLGAKQEHNPLSSECLQAIMECQELSHNVDGPLSSADVEQVGSANLKAGGMAFKDCGSLQPSLCGGNTGTDSSLPALIQPKEQWTDNAKKSISWPTLEVIDVPQNETPKKSSRRGLDLSSDQTVPSLQTPTRQDQDIDELLELEESIFSEQAIEDTLKDPPTKQLILAMDEEDIIEADGGFTVPDHLCPPSQPAAGVFHWSHCLVGADLTPSQHCSDDAAQWRGSASPIGDPSRSLTPVRPIPQCQRRRRVGLSRRQLVYPLHPKKFSDC